MRTLTTKLARQMAAQRKSYGAGSGRQIYQALPMWGHDAGTCQET